VFKSTTDGVLTSLYSFTGGIDGAWPLAGLVQGSDGSFYGTTSAGGSGADGTVFRVTVVRTPPTFLIPTLTNGTVNLTWTTEVGEMYQLQYKSDLSSSTWTNFSSAVTASGSILTATDSITNGSHRFYRAVLLP
jgi:uncharacterized repeat protein (TIGR03803 family)